MKVFKKNKIIKISGLVILVFIIVSVLGLSIVHSLYGNYFKYSEWLTLVLSTLISILGVLGSIITILIAINSINDSKKNTDLRKRKLAIILEYEINTFLVSLFNTFYTCLIDWKVNKFDKYGNPKAEFSNLNKLSNDFKEMLYELISIDENKGSLEIFEFFKVYQKSIKKLDKDILIGLEPLLDIFEFCFKKEYYEYAKLTGIRFNGRCTRALPLSDEEQENLEGFYNLKESLYLDKNKENLLKNEYSYKMDEIFKYLNKIIEKQ